MSKSKYFVALIPPEPLAGEIVAWKKTFQDRFDSKAALRSPAHLTLHMPFEWPDKRSNELLDTFGNAAAASSPFPVQLKGFGAFPPRVIYVDVVPSPALIDFQLQLNLHAKRELMLLHPTRRDRGFHPHLTVAFRDLRKHDFEAAWELVKQEVFDQEWTAKEFAILKHDGKKWHVWHSLSIGPA